MVHEAALKEAATSQTFTYIYHRLKKQFSRLMFHLILL